MHEKLAAYALAAGLLSVPLYAQERLKEPEKCTVTAETASSAPWYNVNGPRLGFDCTSEKQSISGVYVPLSEDGKDPHDAHISLALDLGHGVNATFLAERSVGSNGGGFMAKKTIGKGASVLGRTVFLSNDMKYVDLKLLSKYFDLTLGARNEKDLTTGYGYATANFGKWDDTLTLGLGPDHTKWQNYSAERKNFGIMEIAYQNSNPEFTGIEVYLGGGDIPRMFFSREIDRLIANNDILPKGRSFILAFPSYLAFGETAGEIRGERTEGKEFFVAEAGRKFKLGQVSAGAGGGFEYTLERGRKTWRPAEELYIEFPFKGSTVSAQYRFRKNEGGFYASVSRSFARTP